MLFREGLKFQLMLGYQQFAAFKLRLAYLQFTQIHIYTNLYQNRTTHADSGELFNKISEYFSTALIGDLFLY